MQALVWRREVKHLRCAQLLEHGEYLGTVGDWVPSAPAQTRSQVRGQALPHRIRLGILCTAYIIAQTHTARSDVKNSEHPFRWHALFCAQPVLEMQNELEDGETLRGLAAAAENRTDQVQTPFWGRTGVADIFLGGG